MDIVGKLKTSRIPWLPRPTWHATSSTLQAVRGSCLVSVDVFDRERSDVMTIICSIFLPSRRYQTDRCRTISRQGVAMSSRFLNARPLARANEVQADRHGCSHSLSPAAAITVSSSACNEPILVASYRCWSRSVVSRRP